jgi:hypothetical protein
MRKFRDICRLLDIIDCQAEQIKAFEREHKEREAIFVYLNKKQFPCIGGTSLDVIIRDLGRLFEEQAEQIKAKDEAIRKHLETDDVIWLEQALKGD